MFQEGSILLFNYPSKNRIRIATRFESRRIFVQSIRDLELQPLEPATVRLHPFTRRGRYLVRGMDLAKQRIRHFYVESMRSVKVSEQPLIRLGLYDPISEAPAMMFGPPFTDARHDLIEIQRRIKLMNHWLRSGNSSQCVGAFQLNSQLLRVAA